jgi:hypothetical protein
MSDSACINEHFVSRMALAFSEAPFSRKISTDLGETWLSNLPKMFGLMTETTALKYSACLLEWQTPYGPWTELGSNPSTSTSMKRQHSIFAQISYCYNHKISFCKIFLWSLEQRATLATMSEGFSAQAHLILSPPLFPTTNFCHLSIVNNLNRLHVTKHFRSDTNFLSTKSKPSGLQHH